MQILYKTITIENYSIVPFLTLITSSVMCLVGIITRIYRAIIFRKNHILNQKEAASNVRTPMIEETEAEMIEEAASNVRTSMTEETEAEMIEETETEMSVHIQTIHI